MCDARCQNFGMLRRWGLEKGPLYNWDIQDLGYTCVGGWRKGPRLAV